MTLLRRALLILVLAAFAAPSWAAIGQAGKFVSDLGAEALRVLANGTPNSQRENEFRRLFLKNFDVDWISKFVTGNHWRTATDADRTEFRKLFEDYVVAAYTARLSAYSG